MKRQPITRRDPRARKPMPRSTALQMRLDFRPRRSRLLLRPIVVAGYIR